MKNNSLNLSCKCRAIAKMSTWLLDGERDDEEMQSWNSFTEQSSKYLLPLETTRRLWMSTAWPARVLSLNPSGAELSARRTHKAMEKLKEKQRTHHPSCSCIETTNTLLPERLKLKHNTRRHHSLEKQNWLWDSTS